MTDHEQLLADILAVPTSSDKPKRQAKAEDFTSKYENLGDVANVTINAQPGTVNEGTAREFLEKDDLDPSEWEVVSYRRSEWGDSANPKESVSFTFKKASATSSAPEEADIEELIQFLNAQPMEPVEVGTLNHDTALVVVLGDMQFGKYESPTKDAVARIKRCIDEAAREAMECKPDHIHVAWMGDHVEGFVSQGGANTWRTRLTMMQQTRLVRWAMTYAMKRLAPLTNRLTKAAVPGNHGEPQRFNGKGVTTYDDSHDTEALICVSEAAELSRDFQHVEFFVPETDEMTVLLNIGGVNFAHVHGHQFRPNKHFEWWSRQSFNQDSSMHMADVLLAGHLHHGHIEEDGKRLYVGAPALEAESTWYRHSTGTGGNPGILTLRVQDGQVRTINFIRGESK